MNIAKRKIGFVLASTDHGTMILNRFDYRQIDENRAFGVGYEILEAASYGKEEVQLASGLLDLRRKYFGDGVMALDCGANIGVHTVEFAKHMTGWGRVLAFEPQERIYYALAGNVALNNCFNAKAVHGALGAECCSMKIPCPDYLQPASFGSLEIKKRDESEFIGQQVSYLEKDMADAQCVTIDSLGLDRVDFIKIDVEGMELDVLSGGSECIARTRPAMLIECIKVDKAKLVSWLSDRKYAYFEAGMNILAIHEADPCLKHAASTKKEVA